MKLMFRRLNLRLLRDYLEAYAIAFSNGHNSLTIVYHRSVNYLQWTVHGSFTDMIFIVYLTL